MRLRVVSREVVVVEGDGGGGRWWVRCRTRSITTYRVAHRVPGERGFLDGDLLRQRRGSRDLATEVCTYHHHRVKRGLPVGGRGGWFPGGENLKVVCGGCPEVCRFPVGGWREVPRWGLASTTPGLS